MCFKSLLGHFVMPRDRYIYRLDQPWSDILECSRCRRWRHSWRRWRRGRAAADPAGRGVHWRILQAVQRRVLSAVWVWEQFLKKEKKCLRCLKNRRKAMKNRWSTKQEVGRSRSTHAKLDREVYDQLKSEGFVVFSVVRNPFDRAYSCWVWNNFWRKRSLYW